MSLRKIFCPNCGNATQVDDTKAFCFCLQCGNKIILRAEAAPKSDEQRKVPQVPSAEPAKPALDIVDERLKEAAVSSQVKGTKIRHKVYQERGRVSPQSIPTWKSQYVMD